MYYHHTGSALYVGNWNTGKFADRQLTNVYIGGVPRSHKFVQKSEGEAITRVHTHTHTHTHINFSSYNFCGSLTNLSSTLTKSRLSLLEALGKAIPVRAWTGPQGSRRLSLPDFKTADIWRWKICQPYALAAFTPQEIFLVLISVRCWVDPRAIVRMERIMSMKNFSDTIGNRTSNLSACTRTRNKSREYNVLSHNCCQLLHNN